MAKGKKTGGRDWSKTNQPKVRGKKALPADLRKARELTKANLEGLLNKYLWMTKNELESILSKQNPDVPMIEMMIGSIVHKALVEGDPKRFDFILNRTIGKVADKIDLNAFSENLDKAGEAQIIDLGIEAVKYLKTAEG